MASLEWYPVNPLLNEKGEFYSLSFLKEAKDLKPIQLENEDNPFSQFEVFQSTLGTQTAANLGVVIGDVQGSYRSFILSYEAMMYTDKVVSKPIGGKIYGTRWGAGLRVLLKVSDTQANTKFNFGAIAAASELGLAKVEYRINGIGISKPDILKILPDPGEFNFETYNQIIEAASKVKNYMAKNSEELVAQPFQIFISNEFERDLFKDSRSVIYAAQNILSRNSLNEALGNINGKYSAEIVTAFYQKIGIVNENERPSREERREVQAYMEV